MIKEQSELTPTKQSSPNIGGVYAKDTTDVKLVQHQKTSTPIEVTLLGIVTEVKSLHR